MVEPGHVRPGHNRGESLSAHVRETGDPANHVLRQTYDGHGARHEVPRPRAPRGQSDVRPLRGEEAAVFYKSFGS